MICSKRFKKLAEKYGFRIRKVPYRNDILSVQYRNHHIMTIPKKMYGFIKPSYCPMGWNKPHPDYFRLEHELKNWNLLIKRTPYLKDAYGE
jgi:hypothetical protein